MFTDGYLARICLLLAFVILGFGPGRAHAENAHDGAIVISDPFSRATHKGARTGAGYMTIHNHGSMPDRLIAVSCECSERAEIHQMSMQDNVMHMQHMADGLEIPAGGIVELKPRGKHLMFLGLSHQFVAGQTIQAILTFERAGEVPAVLTINPLRPMKKHDKAGHLGSGHSGHAKE